MAVEFPGNIIPSPGYFKGNFSTDDELMYSMNGYTQKGITIKAGQGVLLLGTVMGRKTGDKKWYKYDDSGVGGVTNEVQTLSQGGSGLTSYTITFSGQTTSSLLTAATAAQVQAALEALSNIAPGDVTVVQTTASPFVFTVTFSGAYADTDVPAMTTTPTGGSGTVVVATTVVGNSADGIDVARGFLRQTVDTGTDAAGSDFQGNLIVMGIVKGDRVTTAGNLDAAAIVDLKARVDSVLGYVKI